MKDTPIQKAIQQIQDNEMLNLSDVKMILIDLLPYERECIINAYCADMEVDLTNDAERYYTQTFKK